MAIAKALFNGILENIFKEGNVIKLFSRVPSEETEAGGVLISGNSYRSYTIQGGDFSISGGAATSAKNMMMYLCDDQGGNGTAQGFGVFGDGGDMLYFGSFETPMSINFNTVPTIKRYNETAKEGIKVTITSTEASASAE